MSAPLRVLSIGAGYFARFHLQSWLAMPEAQLVGLADLDRPKAAAMATELAGPDHGIELSADPLALMQTLAPDIIDIAAPPPAHLELIRAAYSTGARVVICQKPFCASLDEARQAAALAQADGRPLVVHENFRFQPWYRRIRGEIAAGRVGEVYQASFRLRPGDGQGPRAYLDRQPYFQKMERFLIHETGVHWIDTFRYLFGAPEAVFADLRQLNPAIAGEDAGLMMLCFGGGERAVLDANRLVDHAAANTRLTMGEALIEGSAGVLSLDGYGVLRFRAHGQQTSEVLAGADWPEAFGGGCVDALQSHVVAHLLSHGPLENEAADYLRVIEIEEAAYRSAAEGRWVAL